MLTDKNTIAKIKSTVTGWLFMLPSLVFLIGFSIYPIIRTTINSFYSDNMASKQVKYVGFENYVNAFSDPVFPIVLKNTFKFVIIVVPASLILGFALALLLNRQFKGLGIARAAIFYPNVSPLIGFATIWVFLFTPTIGLIDHVTQFLGMGSINWLGNPSIALYTVSFVYIWKEASFIMIFYLSGLQNISQDYYEAATIDGASKFTILRKITIPLIRPTTIFTLTIALVNAFKLVDLVVIMTTRGGPNNSTNLLMHHIYLTGFTFWDQGQAAVLTVVMLLFILIFTLVQFFVLDKGTHYED